MSELGTNITDDEIFDKISKMMDHIKANQELQDSALQQGIDIKNSVRLTDSTVENLAVTVASLLLAKRENDSRYDQLKTLGIKKRSLKTEIVNTYKNQAIQLIERYNAEHK